MDLPPDGTGTGNVRPQRRRNRPPGPSVASGGDATGLARQRQHRPCSHAIVFKDMCADCGEDLRKLDLSGPKASVSIVHNVPELKVSEVKAEQLGKADEVRLLEQRKLVLLVDLDQTIIHTTNENVPNDLPEVHHFQLYGSQSPWYHTKLRPHTKEFLERISTIYELHICTFGARMYAHTIAGFLDPDKNHFAHRILSRDECLNPTSKTGNLKSLFPCGDSLVCIIDDREDVWNFAPNLIAVKPYLYFKNTGDINSPFALERAAKLNKEKLITKEEVAPTDAQTKDSTDTKSEPTEEPKSEPEDSAAPSNEKPEATETSSSQVNPKGSEVNDADDTNEKDKEGGDQKPDDSKEASDEKQSEKSKEPTEQSKEQESDDISKQPIDAEYSKYVLEDDDDYLLYLEDILGRIHKEFYQDFESKKKHLTEGEQMVIPDLKEIVPRVRKSVLHKVNIVFSGVIPTNMPPEKSKPFIMAKSLGANVTKDLVFDGSPLERTTHVVAASFGTVKVIKAQKSRKIKIVNPQWLHSCYERWEHVDERLFPLEEKKSTKKKPVEEQDKISSLASSELDSGESSQSSTKPAEEEPPKADDTLYVYDRVTGKRIRSTGEPVAGPSGLNSPKENARADLNESFEPHQMLDFSPLSNFSAGDLLQMGKEVDDACSEGDDLSAGQSSSSEDGFDDDGEPRAKRARTEADSSSDESMNCDLPKGWSKEDVKLQEAVKRPRIPEMEDYSEDSQEKLDLSESDSSGNGYESGSDADMGADLEREFLGP